MADKPYQSINKDELIVRDLLAVDRTVLANERTLLAYIRTALASLVGGASLVHFFDTGWSYMTGWVLIVVAPVMLLIGFLRYVQVRRDLRLLHQLKT